MHLIVPSEGGAIRKAIPEIGVNVALCAATAAPQSRTTIAATVILVRMFVTSGAYRRAPHARDQ
jgi:hypothetical protein